MKPPVQHVSLRDVTEADLPLLFEHQADPEASRMAAVASKDPEAFAVHWTKILENGAIVKQVILADGAIAGSAVQFERDGLPFVGYWLGRAWWGRGIASRALAQLLAMVETRPLYAWVAKHNAGSIRVLEKNGFVKCDEGTIPPEVSGGEDDVPEYLMKLDGAAGRGG